MGILESIILGIVEGATEFLPISSTYHLIFASQFLKVAADDYTKLFNVFIQSGAILAVLLMYTGRLKKDRKLVIKTCVAFIPTAVLGVLLYRTIKQIFFESYFLMTAIFLLVGFLFFLFEALVRKNIIKPEKSIEALTYGQAFLVGLFQAASFLPGVSRAGAVILVMMLLGFRRDDAAVFSFILSIPTIFSAGLYDLYKTRDILAASTENIFFLCVGFVTAFVVAYFAVKWFISYLQRHTLNLFGAYRLAAGMGVLGFRFLG